MKPIDYFITYALIYIALRPVKIISGPIRTKTRFLPVYIDGKPNKALVKANEKRPGVYIIKVSGVIRYIGYSTNNIYRTMLRHFQSWEDRNQVRITYPKSSTVTARVVYTNTAKQALNLERALIFKLDPPDNPRKDKVYQPSIDETWENYQETETAPF